MKKLKPITLITISLFLSACGLKDVVGPNANGTTNSDSYQPTTKGSNLKYSVQIFGMPDAEVSLNMTGETTTFNGMIFYKCIETLSGVPYDVYLGKKGSLYIHHDTDNDLEEAYLDDSKPAGATYIFTTTDSTNPGIPVQYRGTILEKDITKTINSKTFKNVIHTRTELQYNFNNTGFVTDEVTEYYIAKGVGIIEMDNYQFGKIIAKQTIVSYNIK